MNDSKQKHNEPSLAQVESHVRTMLASRVFHNSDRSRDLLLFLLDRFLKHAGMAKEFEVAEAVFGRSADFDPTNDSIVRVQANRLRHKLRQYYHSTAVPDSFEVGLGRGGYHLEVVPLPLAIVSANEDVELPDSPTPQQQIVAEPEFRLIPQPSDPAANTGWSHTHWMVWSGLAAIVLTAVILVWRFGQPNKTPDLRRITDHSAIASLAKFSADGASIYYGMQKSADSPPEIYATSADHSGPSRLIGYKGMKLFAVSPSGLLLVDGSRGNQLVIGDLSGGPPERSESTVSEARWYDNGKSLLTVRLDAGTAVMEFQGKRLAQASSAAGNPFLHPAISPNGRWIAFGREQRSKTIDSELCVLDRRDGSIRVLMDRWSEFSPPAWIPGTEEIVIGGVRRGQTPQILKISLSGKAKVLWRGTNFTIVEDVRKDGLLLVREVVTRNRVLARLPGLLQHQELPFGQRTTAVALSSDGNSLLLSERPNLESENEKISFWSFLSRGEPRSLGLGFHPAFSPDGKQAVLVKADGTKRRALLVDIQAGTTKDISVGDHRYDWPMWHPNLNAFQFVDTNESAGRVYLQSFDSNDVRPITSPGELHACLQGTGVLLWRRAQLIHRDGNGREKEIGRDILQDRAFTCGRGYFAIKPESPKRTIEIQSVDLARGLLTPLFSVSTPLGSTFVYPMALMSHDGSRYVYTTAEAFSSLHLLNGVCC
jgi:Tol biopolymer transport system component